MKSYSVTIQMKASDQYFPVILFIMVYKVVLTFESVDEILKCYHWTTFSQEIFPEVWFGLELCKWGVISYLIWFIYHPTKPAKATLSSCSLALGTFLACETFLVYSQTINVFVCCFVFFKTAASALLESLQKKTELLRIFLNVSAVWCSLDARDFSFVVWSGEITLASINDRLVYILQWHH